jgi:lysophospholipase L1-like esterase
MVFSVAITGLVVVVSILQAVFFATGRPWTAYSIVAMCLAAANLLLAVRFLATKETRLLWPVLILFGAQLGSFVVQFVISEPPPPLRLLQVAIAVSYLATVMSALLAGVRIVAPINAVLLSLSAAVGIFLGETVLELMHHSAPGNSVKAPEWVGSMEPHPTLGEVYRPYSVLKTYYPDNPRSYFQKEDVRGSKWSLRVAGGNIANLLLPPNNPDIIRVAIGKTETKTGYDIQLNQPHLKVKSNHRYTIAFRARADRPRSVFLGFARAHEPWNGLGLYGKIELATEWKSFQEEFVATADDDNARIHFDVGDSDISVELSSISLRGIPDGESIEPDLSPQRYFISYRFNAMGCRGRDYPIPRPIGSVRILLLGDSYTLGVGVREEDTVSNQLERLLNEKKRATGGGKMYEAINCGVSGYGTREERLFYQLFGAKYEPDIVLLMMVWNDDISFLEEVQRGYVNRSPGKLELLFYSWGKIQDFRHRHPSPDFTKNVDEILRLDGEIRKRGARLVVIIFRNDPDFAGEADSGEIWKRLTDTVTNGLQETGIPILDLGKALYKKYSKEDLTVHPLLDEHPNEIADAIAAREILGVLQRENGRSRTDAPGFVP